MVKVILCESLQSCLQQLQNICRSQAPYCILFPNTHFLEKFCHLCPKVDATHFRTPALLLQECGYVPLTPAEACLLNSIIYDGREDPTLLTLPSEWQWENKSPRTWTALTSQSHGLTLSTLCFFGPWSPGARAKVAQHFQNSETYLVHIKRIFPETSAPREVAMEALPSVGAEFFWIQQRWRPEEQPLVALPHAMIQALGQKQPSFSAQAWIDWQAQPTLGYFLIYLRTCIDAQLFPAYAKELKEAQQQCLTDRFEPIYRALLQNKKTWIAPFTLLLKTPPDKIEAILPSEFRPFVGLIRQATEKLPLKDLWPFLRRLLQQQSGYFSNYISWGEAIYLPLDTAVVPHAIRFREEDDEPIQQWLLEMSVQGAHLQLCYPECDEAGMALQPLLPPGPASQPPVSFRKTHPPKDTLELPLPITLSCKAWERFALCPRKTWLESIMRTEDFSIENFPSKAKFIGETVHRYLDFRNPPQLEEEWVQSIRKKAEKHWENTLQKVETVCLWQWQQCALQISLKMAHRAAEFLTPSTQCFSEWVLPQDAPYTGRIDLLVADRSRKIAYVFDYKTSAHYTFSAAQIDKGSGLQLLLYGQCLKQYFDTVFLVVIHRNGEKTILPFEKINAPHILSWLHQVQTTGVYSSLPDETIEALPLCYCKS